MVVCILLTASLDRCCHDLTGVAIIVDDAKYSWPEEYQDYMYIAPGWGGEADALKLQIMDEVARAVSANETSNLLLSHVPAISITVCLILAAGTHSSDQFSSFDVICRLFIAQIGEKNAQLETQTDAPAVNK